MALGYSGPSLDSDNNRPNLPDSLSPDLLFDPESLSPEIRTKLALYSEVCGFMEVDPQILEHLGLDQSKLDDYNYVYFQQFAEKDSDSQKWADKFCGTLTDLAKSRIEQWQENNSVSSAALGAAVLAETVEANEETRDLGSQNPDMALFEAAYLMMVANRVQARVAVDSTSPESNQYLEAIASEKNKNVVCKRNQKQRILALVDLLDGAETAEDQEAEGEIYQTTSKRGKTIEFLLELGDKFPDRTSNTLKLLGLMYGDNTDPETLGQTIQEILTDFEALERAVKTLGTFVKDSNQVDKANENRRKLGKRRRHTIVRLVDNGLFGDDMIDELKVLNGQYKIAEAKAFESRKLWGIKAKLEQFIKSNKKNIDHAKRELEQVLAEVQYPETEN